ncbi:MAG TPA: 50S ribosomal protein L10 [Acidimicrobiales bacterium]|nr:50S ribosomal protein L10 [Acidimicrobiales bacterium]
MENPRPEKVAVVEEVRGRLSSANATLLTEYRGLKVDELARLRQAIREAGGEYKIYKNTLVRLAVADLGLSELDDLLTGPTAVAFVDGDAVLVAKALREFARAQPALVVKGGVLGTKVLSAADAGALADVAPREVVLAQLAGAFAAPLRQLAGLLAAVPRNFAYGLSALVQKGGTTAPAEAPAATESGHAGGAEPTAPDTPPAVEAPSPEAQVDLPEPETPDGPLPEVPAAAEAVAPETAPTEPQPDESQPIEPTEPPASAGAAE